MSDQKASRIENYLAHMLNAIDRIESYVSDLDRAAFLRTPLVQDAVIRNFEIIGEAANKIVLADPGLLVVTRSCASTSPTGCATP